MSCARSSKRRLDDVQAVPLENRDQLLRNGTRGNDADRRCVARRRRVTGAGADWAYLVASWSVTAKSVVSNRQG